MIIKYSWNMYRGKNPRKLFVAVSCSLATLFLVFLPSLPATAYEQNHLIAAFDISDPTSFNSSALTLTNVAPGGTATTSHGSITYDPSTSSVRFPGGNTHTDYFQAQNGFADFSQGFTIEANFNFGNVADNWERIIDFGDSGPDDNILVARFEQSNELVLEFENGSVGFGRCITDTGETAIQPNTFAVWTITLDGTSCHIYKDGIELDTASSFYSTGISNYSNDPATLGSSFPGLPSNIARYTNLIGASNWPQYDQDTEGAFKRILVYNAALSALQVHNNVVDPASQSPRPSLAMTGEKQTLSFVIGLMTITSGLALVILARLRRYSLR